MEEQTIIRGAAAGAKASKPAGAAASVFDLAKQAKPKRVPPPSVDPEALQIEKGVPLPPVVRRATAWLTVFERMNPGDMVRLTKRQATSFLSWAKSHNKKLAKRAIDDDQAGVWRLE